MKKLSLVTRLTLIMGFVSSIIAFVALLSIVGLVFYSTENEIKNDLAGHYEDVKNLATPEKSEELANYLRANDLSLFIFDNSNDVVARYGIYRNLDDITLNSLTKLSLYEDRELSDFGEYDIYTKNNIQISSRNSVLVILKKSFYLSFALMLPLVWIIVIIVAGSVSKLILSPLLLAKNISHELKTPLARVTSTLQVLLDDVSKETSDKIKYSVEELIQLGGNVDSLLSLSTIKNNLKSKNEDTNLNSELNKFINTIPKRLKLSTKIAPNIVAPVNQGFVNIIFRNLIDNAIKYNIKNGFVKIVLRKSFNNWLFEIENSTNPEDNQKGHGLGTTIVKEICHAQDLKFNLVKKSKTFRVKIEGEL